jgi:hypothetical protein
MSNHAIPRKKLDPAAEQIVANIALEFAKALGRALPALEGQILGGTNIQIETDEGTLFQCRIGPPILNALGGMPLPGIGGRIIH